MTDSTTTRVRKYQANLERLGGAKISVFLTPLANARLKAFAKEKKISRSKALNEILEQCQ